MAVLRSIGSKIFSIALVLVALMLVASAGTSWMAQRLDNGLERIEQRFVPAYANLAEAAMYSLEQALTLRQLVLHAEFERELAEEKLLRGRVDELEEAAVNAVIKARGHLKALLAEADLFSNIARLSRLDTRLEFLVEQMLKHEDGIDQVINALEADDWPRVRLAVAELDRGRGEINRRINQDYAEMYAAFKEASDGLQILQRQVTQASQVLTVIAVLLGLVAAAYLTRNLVRPVRRLLEGARRVEQGSLEVDVPVLSRDEIGQLTATFNGMVDELRKKERIRDTFGRYMDPRIVEGLLLRPELAREEGERRVMTVLFCDMKGSSALGEKLTPTALVAVVNRYLSLMSEPVRSHDGVIDKYIGDAVMAYWGPPFVRPELQAELACKAALGMLRQLEIFRAELPDLLGLRKEVPQIAIRIGIATGDVIVGSIGSEFSRSYSMIGDTVNLASRLEGVNKEYRTGIIIAEGTRRMLGERFVLRELDRLRVAGKNDPEVIYELYGLDESERLPERDAAFAKALAAYRLGDWAVARAGFDALRQQDPAARVFLRRIEQLEAAPPADWDGVWTMTEK